MAEQSPPQRQIPFNKPITGDALADQSREQREEKLRKQAKISKKKKSTAKIKKKGEPVIQPADPGTIIAIDVTGTSGTVKNEITIKQASVPTIQPSPRPKVVPLTSDRKYKK